MLMNIDETIISCAVFIFCALYFLDQTHHFKRKALTLNEQFPAQFLPFKKDSVISRLHEVPIKGIVVNE